ncbi:MAG: tRNA (adenosine(37)-N6)-threonylcarbamoyltransferase complex dimerization subunit type 1 TsaB [Sphingomonas sp.]|uniref:tRNA (adenosine(37)-N6)-threonylcarbamoyltransferase complex dimerization subunit type 1 TsaB n=1 Tax=Sphingomonas sp. TaxID=28214 RepID=UPI001AC78E42|nr:tRNA (adenosine(37)-N6)-threonylcarbamoyltransferase complex dimerization subunit type 1 TsaB [Sphingomonas sp.]MBN8806855.1 tRNA (adenosine(37)-N6)-threonylcarbamoyltransferase complex dimerization subunit type 1 TsaB [Sphingomonas sp.]
MTRTLVIETATAACSVALIEGSRVVAAAHEVVGRGHAERLVPMIAELPDGGRTDAILVDCGPGSFTGIRVGIAAARGLALGWGVPVQGFSSLPLVAARKLAEDNDGLPIAVVLEGGHGEVFMQTFASFPLRAIGPLESLSPAAARVRAGGTTLVGDGVRWLGFGDPREAPRGALPVAADIVLLPAELTELPPRPIYGRAPDAKPMAPAASVPA